MAISILGIIAVQLVWMNNAIKVKNELFDRSVNEALKRTVVRLEDMHNFTVVNEMVFHDSLLWAHENDTDRDIRFFPRPEDVPPAMAGEKPPHPVHIIREIKPDGKNARIEIKVESDKNDSAGTFSYLYNATEGSKNRIMVLNGNPDPKNDVYIVKTDTVIENIDLLYERGVGKIDSLLIHLDTFNIFRPDISKRARIKATQLKNMASQVVAEIYDWDTRNIDHGQITQFLGEELTNANIPLNFNAGIIQQNKMHYLSEGADSADVVNSPFQVTLYPGDIFQKNLKLAVFFPGRDRFIYRSLNWLLLASFLFSLIILATFSLSVFYILRQKKISEMKSDFINNMTHEFKTPIATISVATDSIVNEKVLNDAERIKYFAGMIKKENARMNRQVEDILTIARLDKKDFEFTWEAVDVHELIDDAIQGIKLQIEKRGGKIKTNFQAVNSMATTDKMHCTNVIYNLLDNANKYSAESPEIIISTKNKNYGIILSVEDRGIGMSKTVQSKIFERFYRQASGNIHNVKGFGLGLSYVKAVLEANRGTISVHSEPGKGSRFDVFLPFVRE